MEKKLAKKFHSEEGAKGPRPQTKTEQVIYGDTKRPIAKQHSDLAADGRQTITWVDTSSVFLLANSPTQQAQQLEVSATQPLVS